MKAVIAIIVVVLLGAGTYVLTRPEIEENETATTESRLEEVTKDDTELAEAEEEDEPEGIPLAEPVVAEPAVESAPEPVVVTPEPEPVVVTPEPVVVTPDPEPEPVVALTTYADGTYSSRTSYRSPGGTHSAEATITLENDIVTAATFSSDAGNSTSKKYVDRFKAAFKAEVVGKDLDSVALSRIGGASLTTNGYNDALDLVIAKAAN